MKDFLGIPELRGFEPVRSVDELSAILARLPEDRRLAAMSDKPLVLVNKHTDEVAILRPGDDGSWDVVTEPPSPKRFPPLSATKTLSTRTKRRRGRSDGRPRRR
jgi:hypothetical protein